MKSLKFTPVGLWVLLAVQEMRKVKSDSFSLEGETDRCHSWEWKVFTGEELPDSLGKFMPCSVGHQLHKHSTQEGVCAVWEEELGVFSVCAGQELALLSLTQLPVIHHSVWVKCKLWFVVSCAALSSLWAVRKCRTVFRARWAVLLTHWLFPAQLYRSAIT